MNEAKLSTALVGKETRPMQEEEILRLFHSPRVSWVRWESSGRKALKRHRQPILLVDVALKAART